MIRRSKPVSKRFLLTAWVMLLLCVAPMSAFASQTANAAAGDEITIKLNGQTVKLADPVLIQDNKTFLPVARVAGMLGASVDWDNANQEATIRTAHGDKVVLSSGVPVVYFNEGRYVMDTVPFISGSRLYIPLRTVGELLHASVRWNGEERSAEIETVPLAVVTEEFGLDEIIEQFSTSKKELLQRNGIEAASAVEAGAELRVIIPSVLDNPAKPFTEADLELLAKITQVESGYESYEGQLGVANVILNRVKSSKFPDSIRDVIYSGKQFPPAHNGLLDKSVPNKSVLRAAKDALNGKNNVGDAVYFFNPRVSKGSFWSSLDVITTIGHHRFAK